MFLFYISRWAIILSFWKLLFNEKYKIKTEDQIIQFTAVREEVKKGLTEQLNMKDIKGYKKKFPSRQEESNSRQEK